MSNVYTISRSISILESFLAPFSFDDSLRDVTLLTTSDGSKYLWNNTILPFTLVFVWAAAIIFILRRNTYNCCLQRSFLRIRDGSSRGILGDKDENTSGLHLVTIASDRSQLIRGTIEDQVNYEILRGQMKRVRTLFSILVLFTVIVSYPLLLFVLSMRNSYNHLNRGVKEMGENLNAAVESISWISWESDSLIDTNVDLANSLGSQSIQGCFAGNIDLIQAASAFSSSLLEMNDEIGDTDMQALEELYRNGEEFTNGVESDMGIYSAALWFLIAVLVILDVVSLVLFSGTVFAKKNDNTKILHILYQRICFPLLICASFMMLLSGAVLILVGYLTVDFCSTMGSPTDAIVAALTAKGYGNTTFFDVSKDTMMVRRLLRKTFCWRFELIGLTFLPILQNTCTNNGFASSLFDSIKNGAANSVAFESILPNNFADDCSAYSSLSLSMDDFTNITNIIFPRSNAQSYDFECGKVFDWYSKLAHEETCSNAPMFLNLSLLFVFVLVILSVAMIASNIAWKSNTQVFKGLYSEVEKKQMQDLRADQIGGISDRGGIQSKEFQSHRLMISQRGKSSLGLHDDASYLESMEKVEDGVNQILGEEYHDSSLFGGRSPLERDNSSVLADALALEELELRQTSKRIEGIENYIQSLREEAYRKNEALQHRLGKSSDGINAPGKMQYNLSQHDIEEINPSNPSDTDQASALSSISSGLEYSDSENGTDTDASETDEDTDKQGMEKTNSQKNNWTWKSMIFGRFK